MEMNPFTHEYFMKQALVEAQKAFDAEEVPIGAIVVTENQIIARGHNNSQKLNDFTAHAEMQAFTSASSFLGSKYLSKCTLYVTLEPCIMCAGAAYWTRIGRIIFGAKDSKKGFLTMNNRIIHSKTEILGGVMDKECSKLLKDFFLKRRE
ncbi:MAG: nucleoside deaminase [Bacteroidota bacterium]|nr:nucleoside deaminase [Bacteroidota bacterium]